MTLVQSNNQGTTTGCWMLTEHSEYGGLGLQIAVPAAPAIVGRTAESLITIPCTSVSKRHAELRMEAGRPVLTDLQSTNGTYVNGRPAQDTPLADGDVVQFAAKVFRVRRPASVESCMTAEGNGVAFAAALLDFEELMSGEGVSPHFQPIVTLPEGLSVGYELLARSQLESLRNPGEMFSTAARLGQECALSELMRREGARDALRLPRCGNLFVNTHPKEVIQDRFLASLKELRELAPELAITIEIHEAAITSSDDMQRFRSVLDELDMQLAYDDLALGKHDSTNFLLLPPDVLKFDIKLIRDLDKAPATRFAMVKTLVSMTRDLGIQTLAEGIETEAEAEACHKVGFELAQGYFFGRPNPLEKYQADDAKK